MQAAFATHTGSSWAKKPTEWLKTQKSSKDILDMVSGIAAQQMLPGDPKQHLKSGKVVGHTAGATKTAEPGNIFICLNLILD